MMKGEISKAFRQMMKGEIRKAFRNTMIAKGFMLF